MTNKEFLAKLQAETDNFNKSVSTDKGDWKVKGFIDIAKNIYTISTDTKVVSKVMELLIFPEMVRFSKANNLKLILTEKQNFYPDITFQDESGKYYAVDLKTTFRQKNKKRVNTMTLGTFQGYFRDREHGGNFIKFPYGSYSGHFVLGVIYSRVEGIDERQTHKVSDLEAINSVIKDFLFFVQPKYKIAKDKPGSGNTKNIGAVNIIDDLVDGNGVFAELGEDVFDDYWMYYMNNDMAKAVDLPKPPYKDLETYKIYKGIK